MLTEWETILNDLERDPLSTADRLDWSAKRVLYQQYIGVQPDVVKLLLNNENPNQIARDLQYLTYLARARADLIVTMRSNLERISGLAEETTRQSAELAAIEADQQAQRKVLETEKNARQAVLTKVSRQIAHQRREISTLKRDENRLTKLIEQLSRAGIQYFLLLPIQRIQIVYD